jgi:hypothetical protein
LLLGPLLAVVLYALLWIPSISRTILYAIYIPAVPFALAFGVVSFILKRHPGGPVDKTDGARKTEGLLELDLARLRDTRKLILSNDDTPIRVRRTGYRADASNDVELFRADSRGYRRTNNVLQGIVIIGSLAATGTAGATTAFPSLRYATLGIAFTVGIASGFMGYFKYKERSFYLQQTADAIESESEAFEVGVGRYKRYTEDEEEKALAEFVDELHRLKGEQMKRQQNLEQPPEHRSSGE